MLLFGRKVAWFPPEECLGDIRCGREGKHYRQMVAIPLTMGIGAPRCSGNLFLYVSELNGHALTTTNHPIKHQTSKGAEPSMSCGRGLE